MGKNLLIVESPGKVKTIEKILGKDFEVKSCFGHIRDLEKVDMGINLKKNYQPTYIIPPEKEKVVKDLRKSAKSSEEVWLATDEDREGEAISWHLAEVLHLNLHNTKRIVFHEITKQAIQNAVKNPRTIDMNLVKAQQARRILDRLVGFELSPLLWKKISMKNSLSAGRVQSVALRLIVEREREIQSFSPISSFRIEALLLPQKSINENSGIFKAEGASRFPMEEDAENFLKKCVGAKLKVRDIQVKPTKKSPSPPFTTSTLQQEASQKLGYSVGRTMLLAQKLYESGRITYMRTDSVNISETANENIRAIIQGTYGKQFYQQRAFINRNDKAQEAHEAIRPTFSDQKTQGEQDTMKLFDLIWKRTIASQMSDSEIERTIVKISISESQLELTTEGEVIKFEGFLKVYREGKDDDDDEINYMNKGLLPKLENGQEIELVEMNAKERFSKPAPRFTEASLVKKLEELGIGRPSTYAPTISTIQKRNYVEKKDRDGVVREVRTLNLKAGIISHLKESETTGTEKSKLFPTDLGVVVTDFLKQYFNSVMDYGFTAKIEEEFDEIATGKKVWNRMIDDFYQPFHLDVEKTMENAGRAKGERNLGFDPITGRPVLVRIGRYGPMAQIGAAGDSEKPRFAKLKTNQSIETISLDEAIELFKLPRSIGQFEGEDVIINIGRFGPYAQQDKKFYSLKKEMDPYTIQLDEIIPLIREKRKNQEEKTIKIFESEKIRILQGPYGPYIKQGLKNFKLPKEKTTHPEQLSLEECKSIILEAKLNPSRKKFRSKQSTS